jgi:hypothetical protein
MLIFPTANASGTAQVTVNVDGQMDNATTVFNFTVIAANTPPTILNLPSSATVVLGQSLLIPFKVIDNESGSAALQVQAQILGAVGPSSVQVQGTGSDRALVVEADAPQPSKLSLVVTLQDSAGATSQQTIALAIVVAPRLQIAQDGVELVISSPNSAPGGQVEYRYGFGPGDAWQPLGYIPASIGPLNVVRIPVPAHNMFFRFRY